MEKHHLKSAEWSCSMSVFSIFSSISECTDSEAETVMQLRNELRDKEMKLTDIRLEALSSAHQLDQLREAMNRMQVRNNNPKHCNPCRGVEDWPTCHTVKIWKKVYLKFLNAYYKFF